MDTTSISTGWNRVFALWHIPSSTLMLTTPSQDEVVRHVRCAVVDGCQMDDLMLQITLKGELIGCQHLGADIADVLGLGDGSGRECEEAAAS
jgi:hypothetical protein